MSAYSPPFCAEQERAFSWQTLWLLLCFLAVALGGGVLGSPFVTYVFTFGVAGAGVLVFSVGRSMNTLLAILLVYALCAFYYTLWGLAFFEQDTRNLLAVFKNLLILAGMAWVAVHFRGFPRWLPLTLAAYFLLLTVQPWQAARFSLPWAGYLMNTYVPLAVFFLAFYTVTAKQPHRAFIPASGSLYVGTLLVLISAPVGWLVSHILLDTELISLQQALKGYSHIEGYPRNWWAYLGGNLYLRLSGTAEDPIFYGYLAGFFAYIWLVRGALVWAGLLTLIVIAAVAKGAMMLLLGGVAFWTVLHFLHPLSFLRSLLGALLLAALVGFYVVASGVSQTSADIHVLGLWLPFEQVLKGEVGLFQVLFGHGIGSSGNLYKAMMGSELSHLQWLQGGAESGFGLVFYQTGAVGLGLLLALIACGFKRCQTSAARGLWLVYWANAAVQENLINLNFITLLLVTVAILELSDLRLSDKKDRANASGHYQPHRRA
ncbi:hypothetical protein [Vreelandella massiliensis]|uniref:hypothetical protein n=1 Tax=Vreelandella massiliensis TaxID=1816686 RepID=UPI00096A98C3|nr:hypothetical protein [Halomonas massiliensis]